MTKNNFKFLFLILVLWILGVGSFPRLCQAKSYEIRTVIYYEKDSSILTKENQLALEQVIPLAKKPYWKITISSNGNPGERNVKKLTKQRAERVRQHLIDHGGDPKRLLIGKYGASLPIANPNTKEGRAKNRYVDFDLKPIFEKMPPDIYQDLYGIQPNEEKAKKAH